MKGAKAKPRRQYTGSVSRLNHMVDHSIARRKNFAAKTGSTTNQEMLLDMIDSRIAHMMTKSADLETKIEGIEKVKRPPVRNTRHSPPLQVTKKATAKKVARAEREETEYVDNDIISELVSSIEQLTYEVRNLHSEQEAMKETIERMKQQTFSQKE